MPIGFETSDEVIASIRKIIHSIEIQSKKLKSSVGITGPQFVILREIQKNKDLTTTLIAKKVSLSQPTVTTILDRLEERKLICKQRDTVDKRKWLLTLTESGAAIINTSPYLIGTKFKNDFCLLPQWEQTQILSTLQHIATMLECTETS